MIIASCFALNMTVALAEETVTTESDISQQESTYLSQRSDEELISFVSAHNIIIPEDYVHSPDLGNIIGHNCES